MPYSRSLDCVVIGYNEMPFSAYEQLLHQYGEDSEAYRDLQYSFVEVDQKKQLYVDFLNDVYAMAHPGNGNGSTPKNTFMSGEIPNLAAVYLTNFLLNRGFSAKYINLFQYEKEKLAQYLSQDLVCVAITTTFYVLNQPVIEMVEFIREHNEKVKIIVGGPLIGNHYSRYPQEELLLALNDIGADIYVLDSQGEKTLTSIVASLKDNRDLSLVPNIVYAKDGQLQMTNRIVENNSLDENFIHWQHFSDADLGPTLQTRTARSCAFSCSFCGYPARAGKLTLAGLDTIEKELDAMRALGYVKNVVFIDDTFNVPIKRFKEICRLMIKKNYQFNWYSYFRCSNADEEAIELMARSGCKGVFLGIESGSPTILKNMHKAASVEQYIRGIQWLKSHDIFSFGSFILGFPGETEETINETGDFIKETKLDFYRTQLWYCEPGTPIFSKRDEFGIVGEGFRWEHNTMDSLEAMDYIDRTFLSIKDSVWLPQWSFDFWFVPYILGKGVTLSQFREFMIWTNKILALNIAYVPESQKQMIQQESIQNITSSVRQWQLN